MDFLASGPDGQEIRLTDRSSKVVPKKGGFNETSNNDEPERQRGYCS